MGITFDIQFILYQEPCSIIKHSWNIGQIQYALPAKIAPDMLTIVFGGMHVHSNFPEQEERSGIQGLHTGDT